MKRVVLILAVLVFMATNVRSDTGALAVLDLNNDGTLDLNEAQSAASGIFTSLDGDKSGTLDPRELSGRIDRTPPIAKTRSDLKFS
jgi:hypothetical protein